ncbi:MAG: response regulator transcription factor [Gammaproteobacteria bacterium]
MTGGPTVFVVDDDQTVRGSLQWLLESMKLTVRTFGAAQDFLQTYDTDQPGCVVVDVRMPDISGLQLQEILAQQGIGLPVILITGHGDIATAVRAMKAGAYDFFEKPFNDQLLLERIQQALAADIRLRRDMARQDENAECFNSLTPRETEVLDRVVRGTPNKLIAAELGISIKTVEVHRARVMRKLAVTSVAELTALCVATGACKGKPLVRFGQRPIPRTTQRCYQ